MYMITIAYISRKNAFVDMAASQPLLLKVIINPHLSLQNIMCFFNFLKITT